MSESETLFVRLGGRESIQAVVTDFYERARQDAVLGPVFAVHVDDWASHIATVTDFWSTQSGGPRLYRGGMGRHLRLGLRPEHFSRWLALWQSTAQSRFNEELANEVVALARVIAERLQEMVAGVPILKVG